MDQSANLENNSQTLLTNIVAEYFKEQKRKRRSKLFKRVIYSLILSGIIILAGLEKIEESATKNNPHVGIIDIKGEIMDNQQLSSSDVFMKSLSSAYDSKGLQALILRINSPGGSPVQADYMYSAVRYFKKKYPDIKVYSVCIDTCTSAAYYIASAADEIYANEASIVGSIGVIYNGFGFVGAMEKLGITRRLKTSGNNKGFMDQFSPENPEQDKKLTVMLDLIHEQFIKQVKKGRGDRLKINDEIFSGLIWTGTQAKDLGLIDGFASSGQLMRKVIKINDAVDYTEKHSFIERFAGRFGSAMITQIPESLGMHQGFK